MFRKIKGNLSLFISTLFFASILFNTESYAGKGDYYVFITNAESNSICSYKLDKENGSWTFCDKAAMGDRPMGISLAKNANCIYVSNNNSKSISKITLNPDNGKLSAAQVSVPTADGPMGLCTTKNEACELQSFEIEKSGGNLRPLCSIQAEGSPQSVAVHPNNKFIYVPSSTKDKIFQYQFDADSGKITLISEAPAGERPCALSIDPAGNYLFLANMGSNNIWAYKIDPSSGALYPSSEIEAGATPEGLVVHPKAPFLYAISSCSEELHSIRVDEEVRKKTIVTCKLSRDKNPISDLQLPRALAISPDGKFVFVIQRSQTLGADRDKVAVFQVNPETGELKLSNEFEISEDGEKCIEIFEVHT